MSTGEQLQAQGPAIEFVDGVVSVQTPVESELVAFLIRKGVDPSQIGPEDHALLFDQQNIGEDEGVGELSVDVRNKELCGRFVQVELVAPGVGDEVGEVLTYPEAQQVVQNDGVFAAAIFRVECDSDGKSIGSPEPVRMPNKSVPVIEKPVKDLPDTGYDVATPVTVGAGLLVVGAITTVIGRYFRDRFGRAR